MNRYGMYLKNGEDLIHLTQEETIDKAKQYFAKVKQMPLKEFNKIFIVKEIKDNETFKQSITSRSNKIKHSNS